MNFNPTEKPQRFLPAGCVNLSVDSIEGVNAEDPSKDSRIYINYKFTATPPESEEPQEFSVRQTIWVNATKEVVIPNGKTLYINNHGQTTMAASVEDIKYMKDEGIRPSFTGESDVVGFLAALGQINVNQLQQGNEFGLVNEKDRVQVLNGDGVRLSQLVTQISKILGTDILENKVKAQVAIKDGKYIVLVPCLSNTVIGELDTDSKYFAERRSQEAAKLARKNHFISETGELVWMDKTVWNPVGDATHSDALEAADDVAEDVSEMMMG